MIIVKYPPGALGNFLCSVLINLQSNSKNMDYGKDIKEDILHVWNFDSHSLIKSKKNYKIISCNYDLSKEYFEKYYNNEYQIIFINCVNYFIEYRLNFLHKCPPYFSEEQNKFAMENSWKGFNHPIACDEARRIFRLYQGYEQNHVSLDSRDIIFNFGDFYLEKLEEWENSLLILGEKLKIHIKNLDFWFNNFKYTQKFILDKASKIKQSIKENKFCFGLSENEKGIVLGEYCFLNKIDDNKKFDKIYDNFS